MSFYRPKSVLRLVFIGFSFVALPLVFMLANTIVRVDRLADLSGQAVLRAARIARISRMLAEQITDMERSARQFEVLGDRTLFQVYEKKHVAFQQTIEEFSHLPLDSARQESLASLVKQERGLFETLQTYPRGSQESREALSGFTPLANLAHSFLAENSGLIERDIQAMQRMVGRARTVLIWQAAALAPAVLAFAVFFTLLVARPIRQIDLAIRRLGDGEFSSKIAVSGPQDLEHLGRRLDWLRLRLSELEEQKTKFLRHLSHELKTPLTTIREGAELLVEDLTGDSDLQRREITQILQQNSLRLQKLIENLLDFSVTLSRHSALNLTPVRLSSLIEKVAADHRLAIIAKDVHLELDLPEVSVQGDEEKLKVVIDNLLSNAVKFSPNRGIIRVTLASDENGAVLDVIDSGIGIDSTDRDRVFEPFYQGKTAPEGYVKGTGIGLSVAREYVVAHRGKIEVISGRENGAHLRVSLPIGSGGAEA